MGTTPFDADERGPAVQTYLLGQIDFGRCLELQQQLIAEIAERDDGQITLLLCEHPQIITVGRAGSPAEIAADSRLLRNRQIEVRWVNRGGPCLLHCVGQLAIYALVPLRWHGFTVGDYLERLQAGIVETLDDLGIHGHTPPGRWGVWGRTGQLAALGVAVRQGVTYYGAYLNVCPPLGLFRLVDSEPEETRGGQVPFAGAPTGGWSRPSGCSAQTVPVPFPRRMSCLVAERRGIVRMTTVRAGLVRYLAEAFGCDRYHLYTGHPLLREHAGRMKDEG
jgi:lipoyl(octanoyl) transferase